MIDISKALKIPGWMMTEELFWLAEQAEVHFRIAEIGSWMGRSTRVLADNTKGEVYAIDTWKGSEETSSNLKNKPEGWLLSEFHKNIGDLTNIHIVESDSLKAAILLGNLKFDMVFIDAAHDYENCKSDILSWMPLVSKGGLLCGHDFTNSTSVVMAVRELIPNYQKAPGSIWEITL